jgi:predicted nucleic acid-binding Zn ribbon protein
VVVILRTLGILSVAGGLIWMAVAEIVLHQPRGGQVRLLLIAGVLMLILSVVLSISGQVSAKVAGRRCPRCGKPVSKGHIYCADHLKEAVNQFRDDQRRKGERG